jgi:hypothetical protein
MRTSKINILIVVTSHPAIQPASEAPKAEHQREKREKLECKEFDTKAVLAANEFLIVSNSLPHPSMPQPRCNRCRSPEELGHYRNS